MSLKVVIFGATGFYGSSIVERLAAQKNDFAVFAVSRRSPDHPSCQRLASFGATLVQCDMGQYADVESAILGAWAVYLTIPFDFNELDFMNKALQYGKNVVTACGRCRVRYLVYATATSSLRTLGLPARHYDARSEVETIIRNSATRFIFLRFPIPYEAVMDFLKPKASQNPKQFYSVIPSSTAAIDYMSAADAGNIVWTILKNPEHYVNKTIAVSSEKLTGKDIAQSMSKIMAPIVVHDSQMTTQQFRLLNFPGSLDWANAFELLIRVDHKFSIETGKQLNGGVSLSSFNKWLMTNKHELYESLNDQ